jgi:hypothetical protein
MDPMPNAHATLSKPAVLPLRLMLDTANERVLAGIRLGAAVIALAAGVWLAWVEGRWWLRLTAFASVAFALRWFTSLRAARAALADSSGQYLEITSEHVVIAGLGSERKVARADVQAVELDNDRLVVVLRLKDGEAFPIEPRYGGFTVRELGEVLRRCLWEQTHRDAQP